MKANQWVKFPHLGALVLVPMALLFIALVFNVPEKIYAGRNTPADNGRVVQVVLAEHAKISQFDDIDSTPNGYGKNACGFIAAAAAVGGANWTAYLPELALAAGSAYGQTSGIQPTPLTTALQQVFGVENVAAYNDSTLKAMYNELHARNIVIVDVKVNSVAGIPSDQTPNYAHYARVLGIDMSREEIYIENTLRGGTYWTLSFEDFIAAWRHPETSVSEIPGVAVENVTNWFVVLDHSLLTTDSF